ncbi:MAG TPA: hypothetical protein VM680_18065 [Verrucomicrobiae bacterium]|nr:hypothetical protein [Verrucomicrobiae bacterium]
MKIWAGILGLSAAATLALCGCASYRNSGGAPGAQSETKSERKTGEFYQTETLTPGIGSALFPDPAWR